MAQCKARVRGKKVQTKVIRRLVFASDNCDHWVAHLQALPYDGRHLIDVGRAAHHKDKRLIVGHRCYLSGVAKFRRANSARHKSANSQSRYFSKYGPPSV